MKTQLIAAIESISKLTIAIAQHEGLHGMTAINRATCADILGTLSDAKAQLQSTPRYFDTPAFAHALKSAIGDRPLRDVAVEVGVSISTLSRLRLGNLPDIETFATICYWMNAYPTEFFSVKPVASCRKEPAEPVTAN